MTPEALIVLVPPIGLTALGVLAWMLFWQSWSEHRTNPMGILVMAATWGAIFTYFLKNFLDQMNQVATNLMFLATVILLEELVKALAEVNALATTESKFQRQNDGIFYGVAAALGFIFIETIYYLTGAGDFWQIFWGRLVYTAPAHMAFTGIFGMYYGRAYLSKALIGDGAKREQAPLAVFGNIAHNALERVPLAKRTFLRVAWALFYEVLALVTLHITRNHLILNRPTHGHASSELITEGFLLALYLHLGYDALLSANSAPLRIAGLAGSGLLFIFLLWRFVRLEWQFEQQKERAHGHKRVPVIAGAKS